MRLETRAVHAGAAADAETGALSPPLHLATTFLHAPDGAQDHGYLYQRYDNPTQARLEEAVSALEGAQRSLLLSTGMAAVATLLQALPSGGQVVFQRDLYHGVRVLAEQWLPRWGLEAAFVDTRDPAALRSMLTRRTRALWIETPSNPLMQVVDVSACAVLASAVGALLVVDSTFATPVLQQPIALGADVVMHSATKYMGGHSDVMGGLLCFARDEALAAACFEVRKLHGASASPFNAWLILRGLRSLPARMAMHCANAERVAEALAAHPGVSAVHYPGLRSHSGHALSLRQMSRPGGMLSFEVAAGREAALAVCAATRLFQCATSLGGCESLIEHRASVEGARPVSPPGLLRLSVGLEHADDLIEDLRQALASS
jgi:cystathionine gamma-synthase